ncbi:MAG: S8 family serine peptidase [candidate division Zixibacteria bacterium]|nr:S8 family serine peptidase [candidate division Zixibacteria bacterium]
MHRLAIIPALLITATLAMVGVLSASDQVVVPEAVTAACSRVPADSVMEVLLSFDGDLDAAYFKADPANASLTRIDRYRRIMDQLEVNRRDLESMLTAPLEAMKAAGQVESYKFFTVSKIVLVQTRVDNLANLLQLPGVRLVNLNSAVSLVNPVEERTAAGMEVSATLNAGLNAINVRPLWARHLNGAGQLICSFDTGIDGDHPALSAKWRGNHGASASASWFAPHADTLPNDLVGHGSHVMGIMLGSTDTDTIGVAPGAQWISAAVIDQGANFSTTIADILSAFDWALNPDNDLTTTDDVPDVICNSWGVPKAIYSTCNTTFWNAIDNVEAAGIVTIFAAGNEGPGEVTMRNPADRGSSSINSMSVGAVDPTTLIVADFSSRGPSTCDPSIVKPELVAPGVGIYSSYKDGGYKIMSGTSMAAPFVAGLVAIMRQYNPEATVDQIKYALLAATTDLGPVGEDNAYGMGIIDASRVLDYLPEPPVPPQVELDKIQISSGGDAAADPGEIAEVTLTLHDASGTIDSIGVWLTSMSTMVTAPPDTLWFLFGLGTGYAVGTVPYLVIISSDAVSGQDAAMYLHTVTASSAGGDSTAFTLLVGHRLPGRIIASESGDIRFSATDFGQFGLGSRSIYPAGGDGFSFGTSGNLLYEAGLIVGCNGQMVSDGIRDEFGRFKESDFAPTSADVASLALDQGELLTASYSDSKALLPLPIEINQAVYRTGANFIICEFDIYNPNPAWIDRLGCGVFFDFDINASGDLFGFDTLMGMAYQYDPDSNRYIGLIGVSAEEFAVTAAMAAGKPGFSKQAKYNLVSGTGLRIDSASAGDWYLTVSRMVTQVEAFGHRKMAIALMAATSLEGLRAEAMLALDAYGVLTGVDDGETALPRMIALDQNFPNPFNPQTTIRFAVPSTAQAELAVYNVCGQKVCTLFDGIAGAGENSVVWNGADDSGRSVASGVYFYRLTTDKETISRTMVLLK